MPWLVKVQSFIYIITSNFHNGLYHDKYKYEDIAAIDADDFVPSPLCL
jgi:hypothetical protein